MIKQLDLGNFTVNLTYRRKLSRRDEIKFEKAVTLWKKTWNSQEFKDAFMSYEREVGGYWVKIKPSRWKVWTWYWHWVKGTKAKGFLETNGLSTEQAYEKLMSGSESLSPEIDNEADVYIDIDESFTKNVVGYTSPWVKLQNIYRKFFNMYDEFDLLVNTVHEYLHKLGFDHLRTHSGTLVYDGAELTGTVARKYFSA